MIGDAVRKARAGRGPQLVVAHLLRLTGHGEHDDASYVPDDVRAGHYGRDCLDVATDQLLETGVATADEIEHWKEQAAEEVRIAVAQAQQEPAPDPYRESWSALSSRFAVPDPAPVQPAAFQS